MAVLAAVVDSRNLLGQIASVTGVRQHPQVEGLRSGMRSLGYDVTHVHVGLALPRPADALALLSEHRTNARYKAEVEAADDAEVLLGELHLKDGRRGRRIEEKIVDGACNVCITKYVESIKAHQADVCGVVVLSKDIDLSPAVEHGRACGVPVYVAATDVVQHRPHPYVLLPPTVLAMMAGCDPAASGHSLRQLAALALHDQTPMTWTVASRGGTLVFEHTAGLSGIAAGDLGQLTKGSVLQLHAVDVDFSVPGLEGFPVLVLSRRPAAPPVDYYKVVSREGPLGVRLEPPGPTRLPVPPGGVVPGDRVSVHRTSRRFIGQLPVAAPPRLFDPDTPRIVRVVRALAKGGFIGADSEGTRGLLVSSANFVPGARVPVLQVDVNQRGPFWVPLGSPLLWKS